MTTKLRLFLGSTSILAAALLVVSAYFFPPPGSTSGLITLLALLGLAIASQALGINVDKGGSRTSFDFIIHLAAVQLVGPFGAGAIGGLGALSFQAFSSDRPAHKYIFNACQITVAATCAGLVFLALGGRPSLSELRFPGSLFPYVGAAATYSALNVAAVTSAVSLERGIGISDTLRELKGPLILFDLVFSLLGYGIAALYIATAPWGALALILAVIPLLGLRYFYSINVQLRNLSRDLTRVLVRTIEAQDPYTSGHSVRVSEFARRIARQMGLGYVRTHQIETAALLHDIGKIDRAYRTILTQEGPLTDQQRELIQAHPDRGADLLEPVRSLDEEVLEAIRHHHERYDGDGYPDGLEAEEIPLGARIVMVADTVDAMMTSRSYRGRLEPEDVRRELRMLEGEQFDPEVVEAALEAGVVADAAEVTLDDEEREALERSS